MKMTTENEKAIRNNQHSYFTASFRSLKSYLYANQTEMPNSNNVMLKEFKKLRDVYHCQQCHFTTMLKERLSRHIIDVHASFKTFKCDICTYAADSKGNLEVHIKDNHQDELLLPSTSQTCSSQTCAKPDLNLSHSNPDETSSLSKTDGIIQEKINGGTVHFKEEQILPTQQSSRKRKKVDNTDGATCTKNFCSNASLSGHWALVRLGYQQNHFLLDPNLSIVTIGRSSKCNMICKGEHISRQHIELRTNILSEDLVTWNIVDLKSSTGTYINGTQIPQNQEVVLNNGDLLSIGGNYLDHDVAGQKYIFQYKVKAPLSS